MVQEIILCFMWSSSSSNGTLSIYSFDFFFYCFICGSTAPVKMALTLTERQKRDRKQLFFYKHWTCLHKKQRVEGHSLHNNKQVKEGNILSEYIAHGLIGCFRVRLCCLGYRGWKIEESSWRSPQENSTQQSYKRSQTITVSLPSLFSTVHLLLVKYMADPLYNFYICQEWNSLDMLVS